MAVMDMIYLTIMLFVLAIVFYTLINLHKSFEYTTNLMMRNETAIIIQHFYNLKNSYPYWLLILWFGLLITSLVSAFLIEAHPLFLIASIVIGIINILLSVAFQDVLSNLLISNLAFQEFVSSNLILRFIFTNMPLIASISTFLISLVMVVKNYVIQ